jgi:hypothetical protein
LLDKICYDIKLTPHINTKKKLFILLDRMVRMILRKKNDIKFYFLKLSNNIFNVIYTISEFNYIYKKKSQNGKISRCCILFL